MNGGFSITREQCEQLQKEYVINNCLYYLMKSKDFVSGKITIDEAIEALKKQTRFADEVLTEYKKNRGTFASDYLT